MSTDKKNVLSFEVRPDGVAVVTYDVPGEPVNTLQSSFGEEFEQVLAKLDADATVKAAVIASGKPDTWVAGADIGMLSGVKTAAEAEKLSRMAQDGFKRLVALRKPVVAAVNGAALGGGFELALACHGRVLSDDPKTVLALPEVQLGLLPGGNGLQRLAKIVGLQAVLDFGLTGKNIRASKAKKLGIADDVVAKAILVEVAAKLALSLADSGRKPSKKKGALAALNAKALTEAALEKNPIGRRVLFKQARQMLRKKTYGHYPATERIIDVIEAFASHGFEASADLEARYFGELVVSETSHQLVSIFNATTALKKDTGVEDASVQPRRVAKVGMLGGGLMGGGICYVTIQNVGIPIRLKEKDLEGLARGYKYVNDVYAERLKKRQITRLDHVKKIAMLSGATDYAGFSDCDLVVEAVFENLDLKHQMVRDIEKHCKPDTIFASNTSSIPITKIAAAAARPELVVGMHYFSPVHKMPLLEIIRTEKTAPWVTATAVALGKKQGKTVIVVNDGVGFYTSRILGPLMNEASFVLAEGVKIEDIDGAMRRWGWPVGPITLLDEVGIDIAAHVGPIMVEAFGERMRPPPTMEKLVADNRKGRKNERGFYLYGAAAKKKGKGKHVDTSVYRVLGIDPKRTVPAEEIQMRCSLQFVNEAIRCLGDGVLRSPRDGDIGAIFGLGFPPFRGGPFRYVDSVGAAEVLRRVEAYHSRFGARWEPAPLLVEMAKSGKRFHGE
jgi:3-hydroxyacyl-CoA dehydrogenase/enoyl-CoA hydratase/3-hydroxybutyryl-CoA epimerase